MVDNVTAAKIASYSVGECTHRGQISKVKLNWKQSLITRGTYKPVLRSDESAVDVGIQQKSSQNRFFKISVNHERS